MHEVKIQTLPPVVLAGLFHRGPYTQLGAVFQRLAAWGNEHDAFRPDTRMFAVAWDNPQIIAAQDLRSYAGMTLPAGLPPSAPVESFTLAGGRHATVLHQGPYDGLPAVYASLLGNWLPASGENKADAPCFEEYLNDCRMLPPDQWLTRIHVPLRG